MIMIMIMAKSKQHMMRAFCLIVIFFFLVEEAINVCSSNAQFLCMGSEKQALLSFKRDLADPFDRLSTWIDGDRDCCKWEGVVCDNITGHVKELHLDNGSLRGKLNPSLLDLKELSHLDLSHNSFSGIRIPEFIGSLVSLKHLDLSGARFEGTIPHQLENLSSLIYLNLGAGILYAESLQWISSLSSLEYLYMDSLNLSKASDHWLQAINMIPSLLELDFSFCDLRHIHSLSRVNFTSLRLLDVFNNDFHSSIPSWVFSLTNLVFLELDNSNFLGPFPNVSWSVPSLVTLRASANNLSSTIPHSLFGCSSLRELQLDNNNLQGTIPSAIQNLTKLVTLSLSNNALEGKVPTSLGNLCNLRTVVLGSNKLVGTILEVLDSLSGCLTNSLESLYIDENFFSGQIDQQIGEFKSLKDLSLKGNKISGPIPFSLGKQLSLEILDVSNNQLNGSLPESLGYLSNLIHLDISENMLEGVVSEAHFANLTNLVVLYGSGNSLVLRASPMWIPPFLLHDLRLRSWKLGPQFPTWLKSQKDCNVMDLSNTGLSDSIPSWFWNLSLTTSVMINLSHNQIYGKIPETLPTTGRATVYLGSNKLEGLLPRISSDLGALDLSNNFFSGDISSLLCRPMGEKNSLAILRLGKNHLSGKIPDCWMHWELLQVIELGSNNLTGEIPSSMGSLKRLQSLHLRNNNLSGEIPQSLQNCTMLRVLDFGMNKIIGNIPNWIGISLQNLLVLVLRSNNLSGQIPRVLCELTKLQIFDAAGNTLSGTIPTCFSNFKAMATKPQSTEPIFSSPFSFAVYLETAFVVTRGREDQYNTILPLLTSLDLSQNNLSGQIPRELTSLKGLISLNLSGNHLRGSIPGNIGNMTWILSLDLSRNQLSGKIPLSMSTLNFLSYLNVSYNNLSGEIPLSTQLQSLDVSNFVDNQLLCGPPLPECRRKENRTSVRDDKNGESEDDQEEYWFRLGIAMGFIVGFVGINGPLLSSTTWRRAYFWFAANMWHKISDCLFNLKYMLKNHFYG